MTITDARQILDRLYPSMSEEVKQAFDMANESLEKHIPKKPKRIEHWTMCPVYYENMVSLMTFLSECRDYGAALSFVWTAGKESI